MIAAWFLSDRGSNGAPYERVAYIYQPGGKLQLVTDRLTIPETPIYLDLQSLFAGLY